MADNTSKTQHITALDFDITRAEEQLILLQTRINEVTKQIASNNWTINAIINGQSDYNNLRKEVEELRKRYEEAQKQIDSMREASINAAETMTSDVDNLASSIESKLVNALKNASVAAYEATKDTEDSMLEISRVLGITTSETEKLRSSLFGLGKEYGRSFSDVSDIALRYAQAGNDMNDTLSLTNDFLLALNTAELDVENGVQSLIGIMNQWGMKASDISTVIDKLNYTADNNAVTTQDLVDGLLKASSMAKTAGMSFDDTVGSLTAMKVASGAAGKEVGNAFKSIMAYIQRPDSLKTFDSMGIEVFKDKVTGELLPMMEILQNMSNKWNTSQEEMLNTLIESGDALQMMSEEWAIATDSMEEYTEYQEAVAEATEKANDADSRAQAQAAAGVFRRNYYISLMENFNKAMEISADLVNSEGHSMAENSRYMETLTAKTEQLQTALVELAVTAADAKLLDLAKYALDTATAITANASNLKILIPLVATLGSGLLTVKSMKIGDEIISNFNALKAWGVEIKNTVKHVDSAGNALQDAASNAATLKTGLLAFNGVLTAVTLAITLATAAISNWHEKNQALIKQGEEASKTADSILELSKKYKELSEISTRTAEQDEEYKNVQQDIIDMLGKRAKALDGLVKGSQEYNDELERQIELELKSQEEDMINASKAAKKELDSTVLWKTSGSVKVEYGTETYEALKNAGKLTHYENNGNFANYSVSGDSLQTYANLSEIMDILNEKLLELENTNSDLANSFVDDKVYQKIKENYEQVGEAVEQYLEAEVKRQSIKYVLDPNNELPKTIQEQEAMNKAIIEAIDPTGKLADEIEELITVYGTIDEQKVNFFKIFEESQFSDVKNQLMHLAETGNLNVMTYEKVAAAYGDFGNKMREIGYGANDVVSAVNEFYNGLSDTANSAETASNNLADTYVKLQSFADTISSSESSISSLNKYIETLNNGSGLTAQQVMELCDTYNLLAEQFTLTENGYKIEVSALETLRDAHIEAAATARNSQIEQTRVMQTELLERLKGYGLEITSISNLAEAQAALAEIEYELEHGPNGGTSDAKRKQGLIGVRTEIQSIAKAYEHTQNLADNFYKNLRKSFESVSTSAGKAKDTTEETIDTFKVLIEGFEHLVSLGAYSVDEQIAYYEKLRRELDLTEEQYRSLETTLHKLYRSQVDEQLEAVKEAYEQQKQAVEDYYDGEKETLEKALEEEKTAREEYWDNEITKLKDNLNAQISAAKSAYEEKKKLSEKSYDNQIKALESLRDTELDNIKAVYDAQISALEKIKAARNSERNEEDYQD